MKGCLSSFAWFACRFAFGIGRPHNSGPQSPFVASCCFRFNSKDSLLNGCPGCGWMWLFGVHGQSGFSNPSQSKPVLLALVDVYKDTSPRAYFQPPLNQNSYFCFCVCDLQNCRLETRLDGSFCGRVVLFQTWSSSRVVEIAELSAPDVPRQPFCVEGVYFFECALEMGVRPPGLAWASWGCLVPFIWVWGQICAGICILVSWLLEFVL